MESDASQAKISTEIPKNVPLQQCAEYWYSLMKDELHMAMHPSLYSQEDDILHDCFTHLLEKNFSVFDGSENPKPWIRAVIRNKCKDVLRKRNCVRMTSLQDVNDASTENEYDPVDESTQSPSALLEIREFWEKVQGGLSAEEYHVFQKHYRHDVRVKHIAQDLHMPQSTVKNRLRFGRQRLAHCLESWVD